MEKRDEQKARFHQAERQALWKRANTSRPELRISWMILHECAHAISGAQHDLEFARTYVGLVWQLLGSEMAQALSEAYKENLGYDLDLIKEGKEKWKDN